MESKSSAKETFGDLKTVGAMLERDPALLHEATLYDRHSALHIAANNGQIQAGALPLYYSALFLWRSGTPLMLAARHGKISCVKKLLEAEANILMFDYVHRRTCLHYAAYYGHADCLQAILSAAQSSTVAVSWGFARFVNIRDGRGATPLHLASRQRGLHLLAITVMIFGIWMSTHHDGWRRSLTLPILGLGSFIFVV
ncbi:putative E3 ubiquitin-protein ligase XBAT31 [Morella rubra]|uniref:Putative E3 ubiquitin-protein ligase XBAT31 n=1 Tax=Morella rubra TaxID=262757 RepID=A0A6A1W743_9ROSI|nr:putative E3 ubiquitin-protein ligase XBAT31 [Morella rubra]